MKASYSRMMPVILKIASSLPLSLSSRQMESLSAISDTFLPSIDLCNTTNNNTHDENDPVHNFYKTSASMAKTPQNVALAITEKFAHPAMGMLRFALWMLSTNLGTLILCGRLSLKKEFPYFQKFSEVSPEIQEEILREWSMSYFYLLRMLFNSTKYLTLLFFFTQIDDNNENQSWKAMDYCGPDPEFLKHTKEPSGGNNKKDCIDDDDDDDEKNLFGPLYRGILRPKHSLTETLKQSGFPFHIHDSSSHALTITCDAVIIGSGSGGGVVAGVLAKSGYKVIVLEKGDYFARSTLSLLEGPSMDQMYQGSGLLATEDLGVVILAGSTVGGGSTVNWSASIRTPQHVMDEWCNRHELELFNSKLYKEAMDAVCDRMGVQSSAHEEGFNNAVLRKGCLELGYPVNDIPRNSTPDHYCGWCNFGCKDGKKKGTAETWLVDMMDSGNGLILPRCEAKKILHERNKGKNRDTATGVTFEFDNEVHEVQAKVVVVAGGAMGTPVLFKKSGLKNPNIGKHLHLHPVTMAWGFFPPETPLVNDVWPEKGKRSYEGGIMTAMSTIVADFNQTGYGAVIQTPALHPGMFAALTPWVSGVDFRERMCKFSRTAHIFALARDEGSGEVKSMNTVWYKMDQRDEQKLKRGTEKMLRILVAAGAEEIGTHHCEGKRLKVKGVSWHELQRFIKDESEKGVTELVRPISSAHQMGTCRMGVEASESVVDQRGETWEVEGLYVADSSVFPTALGVNPMVTVQAIAYCTAHSILEVLGRKKERHLFNTTSLNIK